MESSPAPASVVWRTPESSSAKMVDSNESALNPTPFIQSTHNTIGSQIALLLQCQGYNQTYTQRAFSFENVLLDAILELKENPTAVHSGRRGG